MGSSRPYRTRADRVASRATVSPPGFPRSECPKIESPLRGCMCGAASRLGGNVVSASATDRRGARQAGSAVAAHRKSPSPCLRRRVSRPLQSCQQRPSACRRFPTSGATIGDLDHAPGEVARVRECPRVRKCTRPVPARSGCGVCADNKKAYSQGFFPSPLTDSNRRPPPYHGGSGAGPAGTVGHS